MVSTRRTAVDLGCEQRGIIAATDVVPLNRAVGAHRSPLRLRTLVADRLAQLDIEAQGEAGLLIAVDVVLASLLDRARPWSRLTIQVAWDDEDLYLRFAVPVRLPDQPVSFDRRGIALLRALIASAEVTVVDGAAIAVLQQPWSHPRR